MHKQYKSLKDLDLPPGCTRTQPSAKENMHVYQSCLVDNGTTYILNPAYGRGTDLTYCGHYGKGTAWCKSCPFTCQAESQ